MKFLTILYLLSTVLFLFPLYKQFMIIVRSPYGDERIKKKVLMFIYCLSTLAGMWLGYFGVQYAAWFFFLVSILSAVENYRKESENKKRSNRLVKKTKNN